MLKTLKLSFIGSVIIFTLVISGCTSTQKPLPNDNNKNNGQIGMLDEQLPNTGGQKLSTPIITKTASELDRANTISKNIVSLGNVEKAPVVINGDTALVGLKLKDNSILNNNPNINNSISDNFKLPGITYNQTNYEVNNSNYKSLITRRVKEIDPLITNVIVSKDEQITNRLENLRNTIMREIGDISKSIQK